MPPGAAATAIRRERKIKLLEHQNTPFSVRKTVIVKVNDQDRQLPDNTTVKQLLAELKVVGPLAVELNRRVCPKKDHATTTLAEGDVVEIVTIVGGG